MWVEFMTVRNAYVAETWREAFAAEGLSVRVVPPIGYGEKASLRDKVISAGVLFDKERLERGQSTVNLASIYSQALESRTPDPLDIVLEPDRETGTDDNDADSGG